MIAIFYTRDFSVAILDKYNNAAIPSEKRATILSIVSFANNLLYGVGAIIIGALLTSNLFYPRNSLVVVNLVFAVFYGAILIPYLYIHYHKEKGQLK